MEDSDMDGGLMRNQLNDLGLSWAEIEEQCQIHLDTEDPESWRLYLRGSSDALYLGIEGFFLSALFRKSQALLSSCNCIALKQSLQLMFLK